MTTIQTLDMTTIEKGLTLSRDYVFQQDRRKLGEDVESFQLIGTEQLDIEAGNWFLDADGSITYADEAEIGYPLATVKKSASDGTTLGNGLLTIKVNDEPHDIPCVMVKPTHKMVSKGWVANLDTDGECVFVRMTPDTNGDEVISHGVWGRSSKFLVVSPEFDDLLHPLAQAYGSNATRTIALFGATYADGPSNDVKIPAGYVGIVKGDLRAAGRPVNGRHKMASGDFLFAIRESDGAMSTTWCNEGTVASHDPPPGHGLFQIEKCDSRIAHHLVPSGFDTGEWQTNGAGWSVVQPEHGEAKPVTPDEPVVRMRKKDVKNPFEFRLDTSALYDAVREDVVRTAEEVTKRLFTRIEIVLPDGTQTQVDDTHMEFPKLLKVLGCRENAMLVGPAGSFKTTAAKQAAKALDIAYDFIALGPTITESKVFGYMDANGNYVESAFRRIYENGGVFLFDEMDAANPSVMVAINAAIENGHASFPDGLIERHPDALFVCAANTFGRGADRQYVGRNQLDAATLDRFAVINWDYDERLEEKLCGNSDWFKRVVAIRRGVEKAGIRHVVSPRASLKGAKFLTAGLDQTHVEEMLIWKGLDTDSRNRIQQNMR